VLKGLKKHKNFKNIPYLFRLVVWRCVNCATWWMNWSLRNVRFVMLYVVRNVLENVLFVMNIFAIYARLASLLLLFWFLLILNSYDESKVRVICIDCNNNYILGNQVWTFSTRIQKIHTIGSLKNISRWYYVKGTPAFEKI